MNRKGRPLLCAAFFIAVSMQAVGAAWYLRRRYTRFVVAGESMLPAYRPRDCLVIDSKAYASAAPRVGDVVLVPDPRDPARILLKRVAAVTVDGHLDVRGDNPPASTDSRQFGPVPATSVVGRVVGRYWPLLRR